MQAFSTSVPPSQCSVVDDKEGKRLTAIKGPAAEEQGRGHRAKGHSAAACPSCPFFSHVADATSDPRTRVVCLATQTSPHASARVPSQRSSPNSRRAATSSWPMSSSWTGRSAQSGCSSCRCAAVEDNTLAIARARTELRSSGRSHRHPRLSPACHVMPAW